MKELTLKQQIVLDYIKRHIRDLEFPPTCQEIKNALGYSSANSITGYLKALEDKGHIRRTPKISRSIVVLQT